MLSLMNRAFGPSASFSDKIAFSTSVQHIQSIRSDNCVILVDKIKDLITSPSSRLHGLQLLEMAMEQKADIYLKGRWAIILFEILRENGSCVLKELSCKIFCMIMPFMKKDPVIPKSDCDRFIRNLLDVLLSSVENNLEWTEAACRCIYTIIQIFPGQISPIKDRLLAVIFKQVTFSVSSKTFEIFADIFSYLPNYAQLGNEIDFKDGWNYQYLKTFYTMQQILNTFLTFLGEDPYSESRSNSEGYTFESDDHKLDVFPAYMKGVRRYINLCKCLSKMLSKQTKYAVEVPIHLTLSGMSRLFQLQDVSKIKITSIELQIICSSLSQMQIACLLVLESLILNFNLVPHSLLVTQLMCSALEASKLVNISTQHVRQLRLAVWKYLNIWIGMHGNKVTGDIFSGEFTFTEELFKDIIIEGKEYSQVTAIQSSSKSRKSQSTNCVNKSVNKLDQKVCLEALKTLESLAYTGVNNIPNKMFQEIFTKLTQVASLCASSKKYPFPYDDASCRKRLYSTLLAFTVVSKPNQRDPVQSVTAIFKLALRDPSVKVTRVCHKAMATCRLFLHPKKPLPKISYSEDKQRQSNIPNPIQWTAEDFVQNLPVENMSNAPENIPRIAQTFHNPNDSTMQQDEPMEEDVEEKTHYPEHTYTEYSERYIAVADSQRNGEDLLEVSIANQCQDDAESEDEDEEEDEDRSSGEEEIIPEDMQEIYIPTTSKLHTSSVHITPEAVPQNVGDQEYEQLKQYAKTEDNIVESHKNRHLNGVHSVVTDENLPSSSTPLSNENGLYDDEEDDLDDEEDDDEEEEEELLLKPPEKKVTDFYKSTPPSKKQKLENDEENSKGNDKDREHTRSPTLEEMKADLQLDIADIIC